MDLSPSSELAAAAADLHSEPDVESTVQTVLQHTRALTGGDGVADVSADVSADVRWRNWSGPVTEMGFQSVLSLGLGTHRSPLGALSVYSAKVGAFAGGRAEQILASRPAEVD